MALIAMSIAATITYVSNRDPCKVTKKVPIDPDDPSKGTKPEVTILEGATKFFLKPLDVHLKGHIYDNASHLTGRQGSADIGIQTRTNQTNIDAVRFGLAGFENFSGADGNAIVYATRKDVVNGREYKTVTDDVLNALGLDLIAELATEIKKASEVTPDEAKNSDSASSPSG